MGMRLETIYSIFQTNTNIKEYKSDIYNNIGTLFRSYFQSAYGPSGSCEDLTIGGKSVILPYKQMGNLNSTYLFGIDELFIFYIYYLTRHEFSSVLDIGANIGLHSIILSHVGFENITAFEPDPETFNELSNNILINGLQDSVKLVNAAVSDIDGNVKFTRVVGNTMSSHVYGSKIDPYGKLITIDVEARKISSFIAENQLIKLDAESHEFPIINEALSSSKCRPEIILEVGKDTDKDSLFHLLKDSGYVLYAQKNCWGEVLSAGELPSGHQEGTLICSRDILMKKLKSMF